ncbi:MAG: hypothetical protein KIT58_09390 [Planctomycetota bacterium]|nr:hypothetical protein [Planctomycetota bacterium]
MTLALWLLIYLLITYALGKLFEVVVGWKSVGFAFYPGMLAAAGGRFLACLVGQQKSGKVDLMRAGGPTAGDPPAGGAVFRFLYSIGPFVACIAVFVACWTWVLDEPFKVPRLPQLAMEVEAVGEGAQAVGKQLNAFLGQLKSMPVGDWRLWAILYLAFALTVAPAPGRHDLVAVAGLSGALGLVTFVLQKAGVEVVAKGVYGGAFWQALSLLVGMAALVLVLSTIVLLPIKFLRSNKEG